VFRVYGDDRLLFDSGVLQGLRGSKEIDVPLEGVQRLRLVVTDAGDNYFADCANWAGARVREAR
jgi:alpha-glucosidase